jgi:hypothetical protein
LHLHFPTNNLLPAETDIITPPFPLCDNVQLLMIVKPLSPRPKHGPEMAQEVIIKSPPVYAGVNRVVYCRLQYYPPKLVLRIPLLLHTKNRIFSLKVNQEAQ